jgi:transposase-like protein
MGGIVEADETYIGGKAKRGVDNKTPVVSLVERKGRVRSFPVAYVTAGNLKRILQGNVAASAQIMTDQFSSYTGIGKHFASHETVNHSVHEWKRGQAHTNTVEGYFSLLKRGITGTFHHVSQQHLHRYLSEFDFRYNARKTDDVMRAALAVKGIEGKRLQYR